MKSILVPVGPGSEGKAALDIAAQAVLRFGGLVEGVPLRLPVVPSLDWGMVGTVTVQDPGVPPEQVAGEAQAMFMAAMEGKGIRIVEGPYEPEGEITGPVAVWSGATLLGNDVIGQAGRAFDLTCVSQPVGGGGSIATVEAALFDSGGPILIAPHEGTMDFGNTIAVAWNGSDETARTIAFAAPILRGAKRVIVLADESGSRAQPSGALIQRRLKLQGVPAELQLLEEGSAYSGEILLDAAEAAGCDLLIKGAYTQSRIRQIIFGGATKHILANAQMPVFMAH